MKTHKSRKFYPAAMDTLCSKDKNFNVFIKIFPYFHEKIKYLISEIIKIYPNIKENLLFWLKIINVTNYWFREDTIIIELRKRINIL
jgi:hypothetical protein